MARGSMEDFDELFWHRGIRAPNPFGTVGHSLQCDVLPSPFLQQAATEETRGQKQTKP